uniref:Uncharacterized protein n=1 Tax=Romanomermis culicivorax TaxID=13658 RepID=A0A915L9I4_ROMCU
MTLNNQFIAAQSAAFAIHNIKQKVFIFAFSPLNLHILKAHRCQIQSFQVAGRRIEISEIHETQIVSIASIIVVFNALIIGQQIATSIGYQFTFIDFDAFDVCQKDDAFLGLKPDFGPGRVRAFKKIFGLGRAGNSRPDSVY